MKIRLNKFLADAGVSSRRAADEAIRAGKVAVDGRRPALGELVDPQNQKITLNGRIVRGRSTDDQLTLVLNKPLHVITTMHDDRGRATVADYLPNHRRLFPVGRLDAETGGVLLCTTDGELARFLSHPSSMIEKEYEVVARGRLDDHAVNALKAHRVQRLANGSIRFSMLLHEGKNRQVRRMCAQHGLKILTLTRVRLGPVRLQHLRPGAVRTLSEAERRELARLRANAARA